MMQGLQTQNNGPVGNFVDIVMEQSVQVDIVMEQSIQVNNQPQRTH